MSTIWRRLAGDWSAQSVADDAPCVLDRCSCWHRHAGQVHKTMHHTWMCFYSDRNRMCGELVNIGLSLMSQRVPSAQHDVRWREASEGF